MSAVTDLISNATASSYNAPTQYNTWQPSNISGQDSNFNTAVNQNVGLGNASAPAWQTYLSQLTSNPYQTGAQSAANTAGSVYTNTGNQAVGNANALSGASNALLQTSADPQSALYKQQLQNNTDTTNASLAARGLNTSAVGADLAQQSDTNFNTNWINQLLGRQAQGVSTAGAGFNTSGELGASGAGAITAGGSVPLSTYNSGVSTLGSGLAGYNSGVNSIDQTALSQIMNYLGLGANQSNQQGQFNNQYWQNQNAYTTNQNNQNAAFWGSVGNLGQNAGSSFAPMIFAGG